MTIPTRTLLALAAAAAVTATPAAAQIVLHEHEAHGGRSATADRDIPNLRRFGFNDRASSASVESGRWEVCERVRFEGRCAVLRPGVYPSLASLGLNDRISSVRAIGPDARVAAQRYAPSPAATLTVYEHTDFRGASFDTARDVDDFSRFGFAKNVSSVVVTGGTWEMCNRAVYRGRCMTLTPGRYPSLVALGLDDRAMSVRRIEAGTAAPQPREPRRDVARVTFYEGEAFSGRAHTLDRPAERVERFGFEDRAASAIVEGGPWEVCPAPHFDGRCVVLQPGRYPQLRSVGLANRVGSARLAGEHAAATAPAIVLYEGERLTGASYRSTQPVFDFQRAGLPSWIRSAEVIGANWQVCPEPQFGGQCMLLRPGQYPTLASMGLRERIASVQAAGPTDERQAGNERLYQADVTSVRAVVGTPEQRCWVEAEAKQDPNIPGAIAGAVLGGILGRQVGGGSGRDIATVGGAVAGAAVGARVGRGGGEDVQRCEQVPAQARTEYWDVTYRFRGLEHRVQMTAPPGPTVTVNEQGELRGG